MNKEVREHMMKKIYGYYVSFALGLCAKLQIPRLLQDNEYAIDELSKKTNTNEEALLKMMRLLVANDIFEESSPKHFKNNIFSETLMSEFEFLAQLHTTAVFQESWQDLEYSVTTGQSAMKHSKGHSFYDYINKEENKDTRVIFDKAMIDIQHADSQVINDYVDFSKYDKIYDIGGGSGKFLSAIKEKNKHINATLFETEAVIQKIDTKTIADINCVQGDFFHCVPNDGDVYILRHILHNWNDEEAVQILKNCAKNTHEDTNFLVIEMILNEDTEATQETEDIAIYRDIHMLVALEGKQRTLSQFKSLFYKVGMKIEEIILLPSGMKILQLKKDLTT